MATQEFQILEGPSKYDLMLGLFDGNCAKPRLVLFALWDGARTRTVTSVLLSGVSREDGSGESWIVTGYTNGKRVKGYYSTKTRKGNLEMVSS